MEEMEGMEQNNAWEDIFEEDIPQEEGGTDAPQDEPQDSPAEQPPQEGDEAPQEGFSPEMRAAIDSEAQKRVDAAIAKQFAGVLNPYTGKPISTEADLRDYERYYAEEQQKAELREMGVDPARLDALIGNLPVVKQAQEMLERQQAQQANEQLQREFDALREEYPDCGFADMQGMYADEAGRRVLELWRDSPRLTVADAYFLLNRGSILEKQSAAIKQGMRNQMSGKQHLRQTSGGDAAGREVPAEALDALGEYFPEKTREQLIAMYWKNHENDRR